jgi:hypothetical protein
MPENKLTPASGAGQAKSGKQTPGICNNLANGSNGELPNVSWVDAEVPAPRRFD